MTNKFLAKQTPPYLLPILLAITCFFIYLIYRPEEIIINHFIFATFPSLTEIKTTIISTFPLNKFLIYNLPAGLWIMALTLCACNYKLTLFSKKIRLSYFPILIGLTIEFSQLIQITDGTFDLIDIITMLAFTFLSFRINNLNQLSIKPNKIQLIFVSIGVAFLFFGNT